MFYFINFYGIPYFMYFYFKLFNIKLTTCDNIFESLTFLTNTFNNLILDYSN